MASVEIAPIFQIDLLHKVWASQVMKETSDSPSKDVAKIKGIELS